MEGAMTTSLWCLTGRETLQMNASMLDVQCVL